VTLIRRIDAPARAAHQETVADLSKADQKRFIAMMQRIVAASSDQKPIRKMPVELSDRW